MKITNDRQYHKANRKIEKLFNSSPGTPEYAELMELVMECESYEWDKLVVPNLRRHNDLAFVPKYDEASSLSSMYYPGSYDQCCELDNDDMTARHIVKE